MSKAVSNNCFTFPVQFNGVMGTQYRYQWSPWHIPLSGDVRPRYPTPDHVPMTNGSLQTRTIILVIPDCLYQVWNSHNTSNSVPLDLRRPNSNQLTTFGLFHVFRKEVIGVSETSSTTKKGLYHVDKFHWYSLFQMWYKDTEVLSLRTEIAELWPQKHEDLLSKFKKLSWREVRSTTGDNTMLSWDYLAFLDGDRQRNRLPGDL
jgi:hypothetical protein